MERVKGIEPSYAAWEAAVLPLNYTRGGRGLLHGKFGWSLWPGGCGYGSLRTRSSRRWSLGRRHPWRRMVLSNPNPHPPRSVSIARTRVAMTRRRAAFDPSERRQRIRMWKVTADRCAGASVAMDGHGRAPTDDFEHPRSTDQPSPTRSQWHPFRRNSDRRKRLRLIARSGNWGRNEGQWQRS